MPFGLRNAPATFQTLIMKVLDPCREFANPYMDDVVIYSSDWEIHVRHVRHVLDCLRRVGLTANPRKCHWGGSRMGFLGHTIGEGKMTIPEDRVRAIGEYRRPITKKGMRSFVGAVGFYWKYVEMLAKETAVLCPATSKSAPNRIQWTEEMVSAFNSIRHAIAHACSLTIPLVSDKISIVTDASGKGIGGVLQVERSDNWEAAAFFSRQLREAEYRYSATEMEALALVEAVKHFAQEWVQPVSEDRVQAGLGGCDGPALTGEEETEEDKGKGPGGKEPEGEGSEKQEGSAREHPVIEELLHYA